MKVVSSDDYFTVPWTELEFDYSTFNPIREVLEKDQCVNGFRNTQQAIMLWLASCAREGRKIFVKELIEMDKELDGLGR